MSCRKITATVSRREIVGSVRGPAKISGVVERGGPIVDGIYSGGVRQVRQFQDVLESLRVQHQPQHWASWALDGSLEEDRDQFPLGMDGGWQWVDVGPRKAVKFDGSNAAGLYYGTNEDFAWVHEGRIFTLAAWFFPMQDSLGTRLLGTNDPQSTTTTGFSASVNLNGRPTFYIPNATGLTQLIANFTRLGAQPTFHVWVADGSSWAHYLDGTFTQGGILGGDPRVGPSRDPLTIGWRSNATIWNVFTTNAILTDAEIYRLYVAGMNDIQVF